MAAAGPPPGLCQTLLPGGQPGWAGWPPPAGNLELRDTGYKAKTTFKRFTNIYGKDDVINCNQQTAFPL